MKKSIFRIALFLTLALSFIYACAPKPEAVVETTDTSLVSTYLTTDHADAASIRNQLAYGTLKLDGTEYAITPEQAKTLLPLWQAILSLGGDVTTATEEISAVQDQIVSLMSEDQMKAIVDMQITNADLNTFYAEYGVFLPTPDPSVTKVAGKNSGLSQADREATKAASSTDGTSSAGSGAGKLAKNLLFEKVIEYLAAAAGE